MTDMDIRLFSGGAARGLVDHIQARFERRYDCRLRGEFGAVGMMKQRMLAGEPCDALILSRKLMDGLDSEGSLVEGSLRDVGVVSTGLAVLDGAQAPDIAQAEGLAATLEQASGIYVPDMTQSTAGAHMKRVFQQLGILDAIGAKIHEFPNGATAMKTMATQGLSGSVGCTQVTEILYTQGVSLVAPLPQACALDTVYTYGIPMGRRQPELAKALAEALCEPGLDEFKRRNGLAS
ncbi:molybdate ABC transporter substrate-binding protein [Candidimonas nitroreducens]|uniref:Molybdate ABC transporter substrate-binding protein n=1 Tax=Candidimonas nitroreducens TaxID=683354 RepID=A0A225LWX9_9BURK|nr:substrate-binding domain-containing protein [Candidimonas nitroreducens]OWT53738.1 molybdate ABC transporter substrate-binding protein [Candidimonas nitroreducens]